MGALLRRRARCVVSVGGAAAAFVAALVVTQPQAAPAQVPRAHAALTQGLRVGFGSTMEEVRAVYDIRSESSTACSEVDPCIMLAAPADGLSFFFKNDEKLLYEVRADQPFAGSIEGIRLRDSLGDVLAKLGEPLRSPWDFAGNKAFIFAVGARKVRCDFDDSNKCVTIFYFVPDWPGV